MFLMNKNQGRFQECLLLWRNWETEVSSWSNTIRLIYTAPLRDILPKHNVQFPRYADDTQLYLFCEWSSLQSRNQSVQIIQFCMKYIDEWMTSNKLKLSKARPNLY